jgi:hypothetical protein
MVLYFVGAPHHSAGDDWRRDRCIVRTPDKTLPSGWSDHKVPLYAFEWLFLDTKKVQDSYKNV